MGDIFSRTSGRALGDIIDMARRVPFSVPLKVFTVEEANTMRCQCNKLQLRTDMPLRHSGVMEYRDNVCPGCRNVDAKWAVLLCVRCKEVVARMEPTPKDPVDGFAFVAGQTYHLMACSVCQPDITSVVPIERILWRKNNPTPTRTHSHGN